MPDSEQEDGSPLTADASAEPCVPPYHVETDDGRCVWSCSEGTQPDPNGTNPRADECVCQPGLQEVGSDEFGRRVCR